jgi:hypothetical protein
MYAATEYMKKSKEKAGKKLFGKNYRLKDDDEA